MLTLKTKLDTRQVTMEALAEGTEDLIELNGLQTARHGLQQGGLKQFSDVLAGTSAG